RRTLATQPLDGSVLGAGRNAQTLGAVERRHLDDRALDRLGNGQRHLDLEVLAGRLEHRRVLHAGDHEQVARLTAAQPGLALAGQPDAAAVAHAGRDVHAQLADGPLRARAGARGAGILDHRARAVAVRAGLGDREDPLALGLDSAPVADGTYLGGGAGLGARAVTG